MTQNAIIGKALGWTIEMRICGYTWDGCGLEEKQHYDDYDPTDEDSEGDKLYPCKVVTQTDQKSGIAYTWYEPVPDWENDLNAVREAEDALTVSESETYLETLANIIDGRANYEWQDPRLTWLIRHATAAQCAEALAKVLGGRKK